MDNGEAEELGRFRRAIERAELGDLATIIASTLDDMIDVVRHVNDRQFRGRYTLAVEQAAALAAELHRRNQAPTIRAPLVGTA